MLLQPAIKPILTVIASCIICGCSVNKRSDTSFDHLPAIDLHPFGRSFINEQQHLELISSACQFGFSFDDRAFQA